jgi:hypothetical protein
VPATGRHAATRIRTWAGPAPTALNRLPLTTRVWRHMWSRLARRVPREGFEPPNAYVTSLKLVAFDHLATAAMDADRVEQPSLALEASVLPLDHASTERRESDSNTRAHAGTAVPERPLGQARGIPPTVRLRVERRDPDSNRAADRRRPRSSSPLGAPIPSRGTSAFQHRSMLMGRRGFEPRLRAPKARVIVR